MGNGDAGMGRWGDGEMGRWGDGEMKRNYWSLAEKSPRQLLSTSKWLSSPSFRLFDNAQLPIFTWLQLEWVLL
ncbi:hypothetical protein [Calothrix sp. UHCC 0171]|uniref:hypothetical protein n=1 Tax=Calothrix sp. UHCC 0171 TaxID=3110245 RepID=UPI002B20E1DE|nr:hypothetical protein [Calothrix sp. UHCC 0171]MEA5573125.1 hypothetical protein [Calothrix sp. UHCC 0171]